MSLLRSRKSRRTVDTTETMKQFGPVEIHYGKVQQKVNLKYDSWHREILSRFGSLLGENMQDFHFTVAKASQLLLFIRNVLNGKAGKSLLHCKGLSFQVLQSCICFCSLCA